MEDIKENWNKVLEKLSQKVNKPTYEGVIKTTFPVSVEGNTLVISTPSEFIKAMIHPKYDEHFRDATKEIYLNNYLIDFIVKQQELPFQESIKKVSLPNNNVNNNRDYNNLNSKYTFESFVIGNHNRFSNAAAQRVAESPGKAYNPLFIYGGVGLGKTHLMHAIGNYMIQNSRDVKVAYLSSEKFTNDMINSIKDHKMIEFKNKYRNIDLLLIDDIQFIEGKEGTQEEFFHTFNALYDEGKQIVISSDRPPKEISDIEERLRSRFEMGLLADVQAPDFETRIAILKKKAEIEDINVSDEVLHYIASAFKDNVRELEGALIRVIAHASLNNIPTTVNSARIILGREPSKEVSIEGILKAVANFYHIMEEDLKSNIKTKEITWARHVAMYISRDRTKFALQKIGLAFGRKDHTTVIHAYEKVKSLIQTDSAINIEIQSIIDSLVNY
ncbi:MAG: chromosomal replication initiator protein DnaA [Candidatus Sericytochromatia bacterium]|nr:chromosomal replication initiator protein DnaA [Candidatus Sericytochromatia bacterium]